VRASGKFAIPKIIEAACGQYAISRDTFLDTSNKHKPVTAARMVACVAARLITDSTIEGIARACGYAGTYVVYRNMDKYADALGTPAMWVANVEKILDMFDCRKPRDKWTIMPDLTSAELLRRLETATAQTDHRAKRCFNCRQMRSPDGGSCVPCLHEALKERGVAIPTTASPVVFDVSGEAYRVVNV
jgi:hypothetical protein